MREPLFSRMQAAKRRAEVPQQLRHSGILSLLWLRENNLGLRVYFVRGPQGTDLINELCTRIAKYKGGIRFQDLRLMRLRIGESIYGNAPFLRQYANDCNRDLVSGCFAEEGPYVQRMYFGGHREFHTVDCAAIITEAEKKPCRWCGAHVYFKKEWLDYKKTVRCNSRECRAIDHFQKIPQSRGGIALTPKQRESSTPDAWPLLIMNNYLVKVAKELKRGR
jgi:hypothetical protein